MSNDSQRRFAVAINAEALALAWARQESGPAGSVVVVDHEISPRGRLGRLWPHPAERTAVVAMVWRPDLTADQADLVWLGASLGLLAAARQVAGDSAMCGLSWPDVLVDADEQRVGEVRAEVQLGPGRVTSAVVTARLDVAALGALDRDAVLDAMIDGLGAGAAELATGVDRLRETYRSCCVLTGRRVTARLLPRGVARGTVRGVDASGRLELVSSTGLVEPIAVVSFDRLDVVRDDPTRTAD